jgi:hypothetical protein
MRLLLLLRELNWMAIISLTLSVGAVIYTYLTNPTLTGIALAISAVALAKLSERE